MVRPVDLQDNLSKTKISEQVQQLHKSAPEESQKQFAQELAKKVAQNVKHVGVLEQADKIIIHKETEKKKKDATPKKAGRKKKNKPDGEEPANPKIDFIA